MLKQLLMISKHLFEEFAMNLYKNEKIQFLKNGKINKKEQVKLDADDSCDVILVVIIVPSSARLISTH